MIIASVVGGSVDEWSVVGLSVVDGSVVGGFNKTLLKQSSNDNCFVLAFLY